MSDLNMIKPQNVQGIINKFCLTIGMLPTSYKLSLTYEEQILAIGRYLEETVYPAINNNAEALLELQNLYQELKDYVDNYFEDLNVQEEINNKLDEMAQSGELEELISTYLNFTSLLTFNTVQDLKNATNLINGSKVKTFGYYNVNDKGGANYLITNDNTNVDNLIKFEINNNLYAELIYDKQIINGNQLGLHADKKTDDKELLQKIINFCKINNYELLINGYCYVSATIDTKGIKINGVGKIPRTKATYTSSKYGYIGFDYLKNINNGALITFEDFTEDVLISGSGIISDIANPILRCLNSDGKFNLENICICGWLRNQNQEGLLSTYENDDTYINGMHKINNTSVINCGNNGIHINSLELTSFKNNDISFNGNYGLYIEGLNNYNTLTEYSYIIDNKIEGNFNHGIYMENAFNKLVNIINNDFSRNGLYHQLNIEIPTENYAVGCYIKNRNNNIASQENLIFKDNFGEEVQNLLTINITNASNNIFNNISIINNTIYPLSSNSSYLAILEGLSYTDNLINIQNFSNGRKYSAK